MSSHCHGRLRLEDADSNAVLDATSSNLKLKGNNRLGAWQWVYRRADVHRDWQGSLTRRPLDSAASLPLHWHWRWQLMMTFKLVQSRYY